MNYVKNIATTVSDRVILHNTGNLTVHSFNHDITTDDFIIKLKEAFAERHLLINVESKKNTKNGVSVTFKLSPYSGDLIEASKKLIKEGDFDRAIKHLNIASIIEMDNGKVHYELGNAYQAKGEHQKASECFYTAYNLKAMELGFQ